MKNPCVISSIGFAHDNEDLDSFLTEYGLRKKDLRRFTMGESRLLSSCIRAIKNGKLEEGNNYRGGIIVGSNWGSLGSGFAEAEEQDELFDNKFLQASPLSLLKFLSSLPTNRCSIVLGLNSTSVTFGGGENSGLQSIINAASSIRILSKVDYILAGSFEVITESRRELLRFLHAGAITSFFFRLALFLRLLFKKGQLFKHLWKFRVKEPKLPGGAGAVLVEKLDSALARGVEIQGIVTAYGQMGFHDKIDQKILQGQMTRLANEGGLADAVISLHHLSKKHRKIERRVLKKIGFQGKIIHAEDFLPETFSVADIGAVSLAVSLFHCSNARKILVNSFGPHSYSGLLIEKYDD